MIFRKSTYLQMKVLAFVVKFCGREDVYSAFAAIEALLPEVRSLDFIRRRLTRQPFGLVSLV